MNFCISVRHQDQVRKKADELMIDYIDINILYDLIEQYPKKKYVVRIPRGEEINWQELKIFSTKCKLVLAIEDLHMAKECKKRLLDFFWAYPITSYYELQGVLKLGVKEVLLGAPLYFDLTMKELKDVKVRLVANLCYEDYIPRADGIQGTYVRPEDVDRYEEYVDTLEFRTDGLTQEATLLDIYKRREWGGNLNILLTNLGCDVDNRAIPDEFAPARIQCRQNCMRTGTCHFCETAIKFSKTLVKNKKDLS